MRRFWLFFPLLAVGLVSLDASSIARPQPQLSTPQKPETLPLMLFPNGQKLDASSFLVGIYYIGGMAGQTHRRVASQGVIASPTAGGPIQAGFVDAPRDWTNGFRLDVSGSSKAPIHSIALTYSFMAGDNHKETVSKQNSEADMLPTFSINPATGVNSIQRKVSAHYKMPSFQNATLLYSRSLYANPVFSLMAVTGLHVMGLVHKLIAEYTAELSGVDTTQAYTTHESTYGAGPLVGFTATKKLTDSFALRGNFYGSAPYSTHNIKQYNAYQSSPSAGSTSNVNINGNHACTSYVGHVDLEALYHVLLDSGISIQFIAGWHVKQFVNASMLTTFTNLQGSPASSAEQNAVKVGATFIF